MYEDSVGGENSPIKYQNGPGIDNKLKSTTDGTPKYFLQDHLGSTVKMTNSSGSVTETNGYDSFGKPTNSSFSSRYQFTGREYDSFSGLQYSRARFYDPQIGRFISEDPVGFGGGDVNLYGYVSNNPLNATDPTGLYERDVHYYLTYYLARKNGCFTDDVAKQIAAGNQGTDDNPMTSPGLARDFTNSHYHALNDYARPGVGSSAMLPNLPYLGGTYFGQYLHYLQDTFSHEGFPNSTIGHGLRGHTYDKTATDVEKAVRMARVTSGAISGYSLLICGCKGNDWNDDTANIVRTFAGIPTANPFLADIDGGVVGDFNSPFLASPEALKKKMTHLGF